LYPSLKNLRDVTRRIAIAVGKQAVAEGVAEEPEQGVEAAVTGWSWYPDYPEIAAV